MFSRRQLTAIHSDFDTTNLCLLRGIEPRHSEQVITQRTSPYVGLETAFTFPKRSAHTKGTFQFRDITLYTSSKIL